MPRGIPIYHLNVSSMCFILAKHAPKCAYHLFLMHEFKLTMQNTLFHMLKNGPTLTWVKMSNEPPHPMLSLFEEGLALETTPVLSSPYTGNKSFPTLLCFIYSYLVLNSTRCEPTVFGHRLNLRSFLKVAVVPTGSQGLRTLRSFLMQIWVWGLTFLMVSEWEALVKEPVSH